MGIEESLSAIKLIDPKRVLPAHYNTWPPIEVDVNAWKIRVSQETSALPIVLDVGGTLEI
jgi:L-ascorbate metabolism protein UlaG (beta-lactamase superfamily)